MKLKRKLSNFFLTIFGLFIGLLFPAIFVYSKVMEDNAQIIPTINFPFMFWLIVTIVAVAFGYVYTKWIKKIWDRKLQAIAVIKETDTIPDKAPVLTRLLRGSEYSYPIAVLLSFFHSMTFISTSFVTLRDIAIFAAIGMIVVQIIFLIRDVIDNHYKNEIRISTMEKDELKVQKKYLKRLEKGIDKESDEVSNKNKKLLEVKQRIAEIEEANQ